MDSTMLSSGKAAESDPVLMRTGYSSKLSGYAPLSLGDRPTHYGARTTDPGGRDTRLAG